MKKIIVLIVATISLAANVYGQLPYRSYSEFKGDKGAYLKYNLEDRGINYQGKTLGELFSSIELTPVGYMNYLAESNNDNRTYTLGMDVIFSRNLSNVFNPIKDVYITIWWETPFLFDAVQTIEKQYPPEKWVIQHFNFFKDKKIEMLKYKVM